MNDTWTTLTFTATRGWVNVFHTPGGADRLTTSPGVLLQQQTTGGKRRTVFAALAHDGEIVAAPDLDGYTQTITTAAADVWPMLTGGETR